MPHTDGGGMLFLVIKVHPLRGPRPPRSPRLTRALDRAHQEQVAQALFRLRQHDGDIIFAIARLFSDQPALAPATGGHHPARELPLPGLRVRRPPGTPPVPRARTS